MYCKAILFTYSKLCIRKSIHYTYITVALVDTIKTWYGGCVLNCTHVSDTGVSNGAH